MPNPTNSNSPEQKFKEREKLAAAAEQDVQDAVAKVEASPIGDIGSAIDLLFAVSRQNYTSDIPPSEKNK